MKKNIGYFVKSISALLALGVLAGCGQGDKAQMYSSFQNPPEDTKPGVYWYWMNEHVSKDGITKDLEAMKRVGIGEAFIGNIYEGGVPGDIKTLSDEWVDCMRHAIKEGSRLGLKISIFNGPGWSQSGGPWVDEEEAMRYLDYCDTIIDGQQDRAIALRRPYEVFQRVAVLAMPVHGSTLTPKRVEISSRATRPDKLFDGSKSTKVQLNNDKNDIEITLYADEPFDARSLIVYPTGIGFNTECELLALTDGKFVQVAKEFFDRSNTSRQLGPQPAGKLVLSFPKVTASVYKIKMNNLPLNFELAEIELSDEIKIQRVTEKALYKLPNTSNPAWSAYRWNAQRFDDQISVANTGEVVDVTSLCDGDSLRWKGKPGKWRLIHFGMTPTYTTNTPAAPAARGLEIDKLSRKASHKHFNAFVGKVISGLTREERKSLHRVIVDSYEVGPQNWSDDYRERFIEKMGYDPVPYLPVLAGEVVGSVDVSDRFLWDMRRVIADLVAEEYVGGLREIANENGLNLWLENYGHWGFPSEFMYYGSKADEVGGEFWAGSGPSAECRLASSACHVYGKNEVFAESYTAGGNYFKWYPAKLKQKGDWSYTEGINSVIMHVYIHQPYEERMPGVNAWFGIEFNRHNTWFDLSKGWIDYQRRCCYMLRQGVPVRDLCVFIGDDAPQMNYWIDPELSAGYSFDLINSDAIVNRLKVENGKLVLPSGLSYSALVLPPLETMRPEVLTAIEALVKGGATVIANSVPRMSPSLKNYPAADSLLTATAGELFPGDGARVKEVGKGRVYMGGINDALMEIGCAKDVDMPADSHVSWIHRKSDFADIYFLSNQGSETFDGELTFRVSGLKPELWNAVDGSASAVDSYTDSGSETRIALRLLPAQSVFVVFTKDSQLQPQNSDAQPQITPLTSPWNIRFVNKQLGQDFKISSNALFDWKSSDDQRVKYFSGTALYTTQFDWNGEVKAPVYLHLDSVEVVAKVKLNGQELGYLWTAPYELNLAPALVEGNNVLEIEVANLWVNQLVNQYSLPAPQRTIWTLIDAASKSQPLEPSGIFGKCYMYSK